MESPRWSNINPSKYEWERRALDFIKGGLPDHEPYRAWSNFEFISQDGAIYEVDLLVLTKQGFWLVEIKSAPGIITGDAGTWTRRHEGRVVSSDNPLLLANRKAKALVSLLRAQKAAENVKVPRLEPLVFLSSDEVQCQLSGSALHRVLLKDRPADPNRPERKGILAALINRDGPGIDCENRNLIDIKVSKALSRAVEQAGVRPSQRLRKIGDYTVGDLLGEGPGYQDRLAQHVSLANVHRRIRQYNVAQAASEEDRLRLKRAAAREFQINESLNHPNILQVTEFKEHELGPALLFQYPDLNAVRFDHYLATHGSNLTTDRRIVFLREIADAIRSAHNKRIIHRALSPQSILVAHAESDAPRPLIYNWQVGVRGDGSSTGRQTKVEDLIESQSLVYMSPESISDRRLVAEASDVFSLGAIAFHLFASRPPAENLTELAKTLRDNKGLSLSAVVDGVGPKLEEMIKWCTHPEVLNRVGTVDDFLSLLDGVEDELTAPDKSFVADPLQAKRGDRLEGGYVVEKELGYGATAKALLVTKDDAQFVLKIALRDDDNARLRDEAEALRSIQSEFIVHIYDVLEMAGRVVLVLQKAGDETLASKLRKEGVPSLDMLSRFGDDLLSALASLERHGVPHRDIKPDNIGIRSVPKQKNQLILFDFSLTRARLTDLKVGTEGYIDPFLLNRERKIWDVSAERFSAAVVLYEMCVGFGSLPQWGDGKSHEAMTDGELVLEEDKFDPSVREGLVAFFRTALDRDPEKRYHNAEDMRWAWRGVFKEAENQQIRTPHGVEVEIGVSLDQIEPTTPIAALGLSALARNALERADILTVRNLLDAPLADLHMMRGVGNSVRLEITRFVKELHARFPTPEPRKRASTSTSERPPEANLDVLTSVVLGPRGANDERERRIRSAFLGTNAAETRPVDDWPSRSDTADSLAISRDLVEQVLIKDISRWSREPLLTALRTETFEEIQRLGGAITIDELIDWIMSTRSPGETHDTIKRKRFASAIARAAVETEASNQEPRFDLRRRGRKGLIVLTEELALYAEKLGRVADQLCRFDPLLTPLRTSQALLDEPQPSLPEGCRPFSIERLRHLAAAMSDHAAVSSRSELYPRGMPAERALRLGIGAITGLGSGEHEQGLSIDRIRERVKNRYPEAERLPDRPELDDLLLRVGLDVRWNSDKKSYIFNDHSLIKTSGSSVPSRRSTPSGSRSGAISPEIADARAVDDRLRRAFDEGGFLVLTTKPRLLRDCEKRLMRRFKLERISFDDLLFRYLAAEARELDIDWSVVERADGSDRSSQDWRNLLHLVNLAAIKIEADLLNRTEHVLLVHPGFIARYDIMRLLETLRDRVGHDARCPGVWILVATDGSTNMPFLDDAEIPLISPGQRAEVSRAWIETAKDERDRKPS